MESGSACVWSPGRIGPRSAHCRRAQRGQGVERGASRGSCAVQGRARWTTRPQQALGSRPPWCVYCIVCWWCKLSGVGWLAGLDSNVGDVFWISPRWEMRRYGMEGVEMECGGTRAPYVSFCLLFLKSVASPSVQDENKSPAAPELVSFLVRSRCVGGVKPTALQCWGDVSPRSCLPTFEVAPHPIPSLGCILASASQGSCWRLLPDDRMDPLQPQDMVDSSHSSTLKH